MATKFLLEINVWDNWEADEHQFELLNETNEYAKVHYAQNDWRIVEAATGEVLFMYDHMEAVRIAAQEDMKRFNDTAKWRDRFAESKERRIANAAAERRRQQRQVVFGNQEPRVIREEDFDRALQAIFGDPVRTQWYKIDWRREGF